MTPTYGEAHKLTTSKVDYTRYGEHHSGDRHDLYVERDHDGFPRRARLTARDTGEVWHYRREWRAIHDGYGDWREARDAILPCSERAYNAA